MLNCVSLLFNKLYTTLHLLHVLILSTHPNSTSPPLLSQEGKHFFFFFWIKANWRQATETSTSNEAQCALLAGNHLACRRLISPSAAEMTDKRNSFPGCFVEAVSRWNKIISGVVCLAVNSLDSLFQPLGMPNPRHPETREMAIKVLRSSLSGSPPPFFSYCFVLLESALL